MLSIPPIINEFITSRAGQRTRPGGLKQIKIIGLHIQEGENDLSTFFPSVAADSTMAITRSGLRYRMLLNSDTPWTNGDAAEPLLHSPYLQQALWSKGISNTNAYALTIECAGYAGAQDALDHKAAASEGVITQAQHDALVEQCYQWCKLYSLPADAIVRHSDVGQHKYCPGPAINVEAIREEVRAKLNPVTQQSAPLPSVQFFKESGHSIGGGFLGFWRANGDIRIFGFPLREEEKEECEDGVTRDVQYFERARFEYHPELPAGQQVLLGRIGAELIALKAQK